MPLRTNRLSPTILHISLVVVTAFVREAHSDDAVRFGRDVLPVLSANCFSCHGPDDSARKANLRLDLEAEAKSVHDSGIPVVPGKPDESTLIDRITSSDPETVMPPRDSHKQLSAEQIAILRRWVAEGGVWGRHWSFEPVERPEIAGTNGRSPIDTLVERTLKEKQLSLRPEAEPHQLLRRVSLDLIGLPPTPDAADQFAADPSDKAYEAAVDRLLASPEFGEHWARMWMDLARYADTKGYEKDLGRTMWPYRDWLINAINVDMPLDQMTREQLAGDLLPDSTNDQRIATAFHRNTMSNDEGGTDDEEFRTIAVKDRVDTTMQVWMGLTAGCAKCHTHKYDPISQHEYYALYDIFNQTQDADRYDDAPTLEVTLKSIEEQRTQVRSAIADLTSRLEQAEFRSAQSSGWHFGKITEPVSENGAAFELRPDNSVVVTGTKVADDVYSLSIDLKPGRHSVLRLEVLPEKFDDGQVGVGRNPRDPNFVLSELEAILHSDGEQKPLTLVNPRADFSQNGWPVENAIDGNTKTGWAVSPRQRERHVAMFEFREPLDVVSRATVKIILRQHYGDSLVLKRFRLSTIEQPVAAVKPSEPSAEERQLIDELAAANKELQDLNARVPRIPIMRAVEEGKQRITKIHRRGNFLDPGEQVAAAFPRSFHGQPDGLTPNRLAVAEWLMNPQNTLTPRVWANRIWARLFGVGIVETEEDFGALGALPTHPELLDWLAAEYRDNGWSLKKFLKVIVISRTYRQSSDITSELKERDPVNRLLSRGSRFRLAAEVVRDQALATAGLLSLKKGGPPVMPPQPEGLWRSTYNGQKWINAEGEDRFRRGLYTYLKRTTPYPSMTTFDGGSGEVCQIRRIRTNTPLQALVTMNDPVFLEASAALAARMCDVRGDAKDRADHGMRLALIRPLHNFESEPLLKLQADSEASFLTDPEKAASLIKTTRASVPAQTSPEEFASWIIVASTILNLDEYLTRN